MNYDDRLHVVLGASGGLGNAVVQVLIQQGKLMHPIPIRLSKILPEGWFQQTPKLRVASPLMLSLLGWFSPMMRELQEISYEFEQPFVVDHHKYEAVFGRDTTPPHREAIRKTIDWFHNLGDRKACGERLAGIGRSARISEKSNGKG